MHLVGGGGKSRDDKERRTETPRSDYVIISIHKSGAVYDENGIKPVRYPSLEPLLSEKYFDGILSTKVEEIKRTVDIVNNKKICIKEQIEIPVDNKLKRFEVQYYPGIRYSCQLKIREINDVWSKINKLKIKLLSKEIICNDYMRILIFISLENDVGHNPTYHEICKQMGITNNTARIKIRSLIKEGYLIEIKNGRTKNLMITEKGKAILS